MLNMGKKATLNNSYFSFISASFQCDMHVYYKQSNLLNLWTFFHQWTNPWRWSRHKMINCV